MVKLVSLVLICLFLTIPISFASSDYYSVFEKVYDDIGTINHIEPIIENDELQGFVVLNKPGKKVTVDYFPNQEPITVSLIGTPMSSINYTDDGDTLHIIILEYRGSSAYAKQFRMINSELDETEKFLYSFGTADGYDLIKGECSFLSDEDNIPTGIYFDCLISLHWYMTYPDYTQITNAVSQLYDITLSAKLAEEKAVQSRYYEDSSTLDTLIISSGKFYMYDIRAHGYDPDIVKEDDYTVHEILMSDGYQLFFEQTEYGQFNSFSIDDYDYNSPAKEILYHYQGYDFVGTNQYSNNYMAMFEFDINGFSELWRYSTEKGQIAYHNHSNSNLIYQSGTSTLLFLSAENGTLVDSLEFIRPCSVLTIFDGNPSDNSFSLATASKDSLFLFRFDQVTSIGENYPEPEIPKTFYLEQNNPNPFNAFTRVSFQNDITQYLEMGVYNILGQKVKTLAARIFGPGRYDFYWDGKDEQGFDQSSGIYFGRLESREQTEMIKLIYMK